MGQSDTNDEARDARTGDEIEAGLTRRQFVIGAGGLAGASVLGGGFAMRYLPLRDWYYRLTGRYGEAGAVPSPSGATVFFDTLPSRVLGFDVEYGIALPPGVRRGERLPVCFCLPGRGSTARAVLGASLYMADFVGQAVSERGTPPFALAAIDGGESYWHRRTGGEDRMKMLLDEFLPLCAETYRLGAGDNKRALMGWSMGGYGALRAAELEPATFVAVAASSPAIWTSYAAMTGSVGDAFDSAADYAANDVFAAVDRLATVDVRIDCGTADAFCAADRAFVAALPNPPAGGFTAGGHNTDFWRRVAPDQVDFLGRALRA
jgi:S-formylglutathione hydrolase FrmB